MPRPLPRVLTALLVLAGLTARVSSLDPPRSTTPVASFRPEIDFSLCGLENALAKVVAG